jgi:Micro-tubular organiser Mto1 C-term Mto2-binding region
VTPVFAFLGLGAQEILLLAVLGGMVAVVVFIVMTTNRTTRGTAPDRVADLEEENRRLRAELDRQKGGSPSPPPPPPMG